MDYVKARKLTKEFTFDKNKISPIIADDWEYYFEGDKLFFKSEKNDFVGRIIRLVVFTRDMILSDNYKFDGNKLLGEYVFTSEGFIDKKLFDSAVEYLFENQVDYFTESDFIEGKTYITETGYKYYFLGEVTSFNIDSHYGNIYKITEKNVFYSDNKDTLVKFTRAMKFIEEIDDKRLFNYAIDYMSNHYQYMYVSLFNNDIKEIDSNDVYIKDNKIHYYPEEDRYFFRVYNDFLNMDFIKEMEEEAIENGRNHAYKEYYLEITDINNFLRSLINIENIKDSKYINKEKYFTGVSLITSNIFKLKFFYR